MSTDLRCAVRTRARGDLPVATAAAAATHVLVETPRPWPKDLGTTELHAAVAAVAGPGARVHGAVPADDRAPGEVAVVVHVAPPGPFAGYRRGSAIVPAAEVPATVAALVAATGAAGPGVTVDDPGADLLVCTHGTRDRCCGADGTALARRVAAAGLPARVWPSSHLGGHRFAPTALHLPSGTAWAWLDEATVAAVVERSRSVADLIGHYRGSAAVAHPAAQALEAHAFAEVGWSWLDGPREAVVHAEVEAATAWDVEVVGAGRAWRAVVAEVGRRPQLACGTPTETAKSDPVWSVIPV